MKSQLVFFAILEVLANGGRLIAAPNSTYPVERNLYVLGVGLDQAAGVSGGWVGVGDKGAWKQTLAGAVLNGQLYTAESGGGLYKTNLTDGTWQQVGKAEFGSTAYMFAASKTLYTIETDGSLYHVDPNDGSWTRLGEPGEWKSTIAGTILNHQLYTIEDNGGLFVTDLATGKWQQIGQPEFAKTSFIMAANNLIYALGTDGSLYKIDPAVRHWNLVGKPGAWKRAVARIGYHNQLITAENDGCLYVTNLATGARTRLGEHDFGNTAFMFGTKDALYTIETDGSLYRVFLKPGGGIDAFDWCPEEIEKVFREQGKSFCQQIVSKQIIGAQATRAGIAQGLYWLHQNATRNDLVVMYVGCHGSTDDNKGWGIVTADGRMFWGRELKVALSQLPCQVLLMVETCTSGGFALPHKNDPPVPSNVTALCACSANQTTDNQLDIAVAEALWGRADFNKDGIITLDEVIRYLPLRYKEWWPNPTTTDGSQSPVIVKAPGTPGTLPLTLVSPALSAVDVQDTLWSAILEGQNGDNYQVHLLGWSSQQGQPYYLTDSVTRDFISLPGDGKPVLVQQDGQWCPARLNGQDGRGYKIHLLGKNQDEVVPANRIQYPFVGAAVGN